jgi:hypothetical protein
MLLPLGLLVLPASPPGALPRLISALALRVLLWLRQLWVMRGWANFRLLDRP